MSRDVKRGTAARPFRLGTRGSDLALTQSGGVASQLEAAGHATRLEVIRTAGDRSQAPSFGTIGAQGVFVREIENALLAGDIDLAVHSFKDLPTISPPGLVIAAVPAREDSADVLLAGEDRLDAAMGGWVPLARGVRVGTSSVRRGAWLRHLRPDLVVEPLRGNVPTRVRKLREGRYDAIVLAAAGLARLEEGGDALRDALEGLVTFRLDPQHFVPAPAQGALAIQCREDRADVLAALAALDDPASRAAVTIERAALALAEGGCNTAFGAYCVVQESGFELTAMLERNRRMLSAGVFGETPERTVENLWDLLGAPA
ncbi:MAG TPA: hydroxymethylbilane synthase [Gammaproteobacteria bacterium]|nr:hydroxymethylbilane synthase [Gammaproteobacteria bacterium]